MSEEGRAAAPRDKTEAKTPLMAPPPRPPLALVPPRVPDGRLMKEASLDAEDEAEESRG